MTTPNLSSEYSNSPSSDQSNNLSGFIDTPSKVGAASLQNQLKALEELASTISRNHGLSYNISFLNPDKSIHTQITSSNNLYDTIFNPRSYTQSDLQHPGSQLDAQQRASNKSLGSSGGLALGADDYEGLALENKSEPESEPILHDFKIKTLDLSVEQDVSNYLYSCFEEFQQTACKDVAKRWISTCEPNKQSLHPYKNGERSKPEWWPRNVRHKEPDHLKKEERVPLLIAIMRSFKNDEAKYKTMLCDARSSKIIGRNDDKARKIRLRLILKEMFKVVSMEPERRGNRTTQVSVEVISPVHQKSQEPLQPIDLPSPLDLLTPSFPNPNLYQI
ncbi:unnamed protein product [Ambrosiozyma monospora]|uniref:Unnamed protein product n=1 Tax=Ambrosiozyma monospora TaxID=43982 RepID=A0A9W7DJ28_AMBMO|nr:unnamed protein product [Ambrosiozyma monospora]